MEKQCMAVCGRSVFSRRLYEYILGKYKDEYDVVSFSSEEAFSEFRKSSCAKIILAEEDFDLSGENANECVIKLSEKESDKEKHEVFKYMGADRIMQDVLSIYAAGQTARNVETVFGNKAIIGVYTPIKRSFQTTFALTLGQILSKKKKTLYLNFESYSGFDVICKSAGKANILDLIYFSECDNKNFMSRVDSMTESIGTLDYISPATAYLQYTTVTKEQWIKLLDNLEKKTDYEYIILDLSEQVNGLLDVLRRCTKIFTITDEERMASAKIAQYENMLKEAYYEDLLLKTENIKIPTFKEIPTQFEMLPYSQLAEYIKKSIKVEKEEMENGNNV